MSKIADTEANATSLDGLVNDNGLIATLRNGPKPSWQYLVDEVRNSRGFRVVGAFADGFTYELFNDVGIDVDGNSWIYTGAGAPNKVVSAGTVPSAPNYEQVTFNSAEKVYFIDGSSVQQYKDNLNASGIPSDNGNVQSDLNEQRNGDQYYSKLQRQMLAEQLKKPRNKESITFTWYGDSNSVRENKAVQVAFRGTLQGAYGSSYILPTIDRATSGFSAKDSFETYTTDHAGDISIINFGTNDATTQEGYPSLDGNIEQYLYWIEQLILRELDWGKPVVLVSPLPTRFDKAYETYTYDSPSDPYPAFKRIDAYQMGNALKYLASKYSIPLIDSVEAMANYKDEMFAASTQSINVGTSFGDPVHLDAGYGNAWGAKIAAAFIGDLVMHPVKVQDGDMLNITHGSSPVILNSSRDPDDVYTYYDDSAEAAFAQGDDHVGNRALLITAGERVTFSFYSATDNLIAIPTYFIFTNSNALVFLDNREVQPPIKIDNSVSGTDYGNTEYNQITTSTAYVNRPYGLEKLNTREETSNHLYVSCKGWHTLTILCNSGSIAVSGLNFWSAFHYEQKALPTTDKEGITGSLTANGGESSDLLTAVNGSTYLCTAVNNASGTQRCSQILSVDGNGANYMIDTIHSDFCEFVFNGSSIRAKNNSGFANSYRYKIKKI